VTFVLCVACAQVGRQVASSASVEATEERNERRLIFMLWHGRFSIM
jgi:hypothetical protein